MKKIALIIFGILFFAGTCFARDYYALVEILIKNNAGTAFVMSTITKTPDEKSCQAVLNPVNHLKDEYQVRTDCVNGPAWDNLFGSVFANKPASGAYISYKDLSGYETRVNSKVLVNLESSSSSVPIDMNEKEVISWAKAIIEALKKGGIKNARVVYPVKK
ncbi:MAG: hypothetical protein PHQ84_01770 [Candidatus Omnitrophica bacterium]|jgi:hypothetical protein|nr:hypothetical protein [Candidatus Omnitrophota bacterium]MDD5077711.1 hypothetical protein [Candidatus Omnitrophota bacterium]MDD5725060.1 hypothetical protein [Candidatus Omnitrophota bacterium]